MYGADAEDEAWVNVKNTTFSLAKTLDALFKMHNRSGVHLQINLLNDTDRRKTLLTIFDETIIYDCLA